LITSVVEQLPLKKGNFPNFSSRTSPRIAGLVGLKPDKSTVKSLWKMVYCR